MPHAEALFTDAELSFSQWVILMALRDKRAETCADIARHMNYDTGAITRLVDQLEKRGLVARARSTTDRRIVHLKLLPQGKAMAKRLTPLIVGFWNRVLVDVSHIDVERLVEMLSIVLGFRHANPGSRGRHGHVLRHHGDDLTGRRSGAQNSLGLGHIQLLAYRRRQLRRLDHHDGLGFSRSVTPKPPRGTHDRL